MGGPIWSSVKFSPFSATEKRGEPVSNSIKEWMMRKIIYVTCKGQHQKTNRQAHRRTTTTPTPLLTFIQSPLFRTAEVYSVHVLNNFIHFRSVPKFLSTLSHYRRYRNFRAFSCVLITCICIVRVIASLVASRHQ